MTYRDYYNDIDIDQKKNDMDKFAVLVGVFDTTRLFMDEFDTKNSRRGGGNVSVSVSRWRDYCQSHFYISASPGIERRDFIMVGS